MPKKYEVIRLVKQNAGCHLITDFVEGQLLTEYIRTNQMIEKEELFRFVKQFIKQLEYLQKVKGVKSYHYITPFCIVLKRNKEIVLLDLNAQSNQHILNQITRENIRSRFFPENGPGNDFYPAGKTIQFLLAKSQTVPPLEHKEEYKFQRVISKCLSDNSKKQYHTFSEILLDLPQLPEKKIKQLKKKIVIAVLAIGLTAGTVTAVYFATKTERKPDQEVYHLEDETDFFEIGMTYFLELEDYKKSMLMFEKEKRNVLAKEYKQLAAYMTGESMQGEEEIERVLKTIESESEEMQNSAWKRAILRAYAKLDTPYARARCVELGTEMLRNTEWKQEDSNHKAEQEIREILAVIYEKEKDYERALKEYEELSIVMPGEEVYCAMLRVTEEGNMTERAADIYARGIQEVPESEKLRVMYLRLQFYDSAVSEEARIEMVRQMLKECPGFPENEAFQKLQEECGIRVEGENVWVET